MILREWKLNHGHSDTHTFRSDEPNMILRLAYLIPHTELFNPLHTMLPDHTQHDHTACLLIFLAEVDHTVVAFAMVGLRRAADTRASPRHTPSCTWQLGLVHVGPYLFITDRVIPTKGIYVKEYMLHQQRNWTLWLYICK